jgi:hypothetical protein
MRLPPVGGLAVLGVCLLVVAPARSEDSTPVPPLPELAGFGVRVRADFFKHDLAQTFPAEFFYHESLPEGDIDSFVQSTNHAHLEPFPCAGRAGLYLVVNGDSLATSTRSRYPVKLFTAEKSTFSIRQPIFLDGKVASVGEVAVTSPIHSELHTTKTALKCPADQLIRGLVKVRFETGLEKDDQKITVEVEKRMSGWLDQEWDKWLPKINKWYHDQVLENLSRAGVGRDEVRFYSDEAALWMTIHANELHLPAPPKGPEHPVVLRLHPAAFNLLANRNLAGKSYNEEELEKLAADASRFLRLPAPPKREERPLLVTLAPKDPLTLTVDGADLLLTLRGESYEVNDKRYPGMNVTARYRITRTGHELHLSRDEQLEVLPPDFENGRNLGARQQVLRSVLRRHIGRLLPLDVPLRDIPLDDAGRNAGMPEDLSISGSFRIDLVETQGGWVTVGLLYQPGKKSAPNSGS